MSTIDAFRRWGYLEADLDWLDRLEPLTHPDLEAAGDSEEAATGRRAYCGTLGVEFMHIPDPERRAWIAERMEAEPAAPDRGRVLRLLARAQTLEQGLQTKYIGTKRFSIEGIEALIPLLAEVLDAATAYPVRQAVVAMSHRGRLNVMALIAGVPVAHLLAGFEDVDPRSILGAGDVKYHLGATGTFETASGNRVGIHLVSNPSHLEAVDPIAIGRCRAKLDRLGDEAAVLPVLLHGDAAFAGQGITAETLNMADIPGFSVGGTLHVIVNNLIGFTAEPRVLHSGRFASDVAKRLPIPIFHVNGEDPDAVCRAARLAVDYRFAFGTDVVVDLIGFRRHGHSEVDDPTVTQPRLYARIAERPPLWQSYAERAGADPDEVGAMVDALRAEIDEAKRAVSSLGEMPRLSKPPGYWEGFTGGAWKPEHEIDTGLDETALQRLGEALCAYPEGFHIHPKIERLLEQRRQMARGDKPLDFAMAEALAFASLVDAGVSVRMSGQDSRRGTFNQRHAALIDTEDSSAYLPLARLAAERREASAEAGTGAGTGPRFEIYDSVLSEAAALGFEYGYSRDAPESLVLWEAQFGDFVNGAQVILDQFVTAGEDKWGLLSGLVVLLPHGFEGQGPEHSSARIERFLQLAAEDAIQVAQPSTAAQYFHLLRRQALRRWRKPLIVFTPKSMLRNPRAASGLAELAVPRFAPVLSDGHDGSDRLLLCSGKIAHELRSERERREDPDVGVVTIEQLYPFPEREIRAILERHPGVRELLWVQEEPANMGALSFVEPRLERLLGSRHLRTVKRSASASPATGSAKAHQLEQQALLELAFS
jgi:2-oxoglutarate dehydrogenase E1 component